MRCRHGTSWIIHTRADVAYEGDVAYEWCWRCGSFRHLRVEAAGAVVDSVWATPVGPEGKNPYYRWRKLTDAMHRRREQRRGR